MTAHRGISWLTIVFLVALVFFIGMMAYAGSW